MKKFLSSTLIVPTLIWFLLVCFSPSQQSKSEYGTGFMFKYEPNFKDRREAEETLEGHVHSVINHYKKQEAEGLSFIKDPLPTRDFHRKFSGMKLTFQDSQVYGLSRFHVEDLQADLAKLKVTMKLDIQELIVAGSYVLNSWFSKSQAEFNVSIFGTKINVDGELMIDDAGSLQVGNLALDFTYESVETKMGNTGFVGKMLQGIVNKVGSFVFDTVQPTMWFAMEAKLREVLDSESKDIPKQFPNAINPFDKHLAHARKLIKERNLDPVLLADYSTQSSKWSKFELFNGNLYDLSSIRRNGPILLGFENNMTYMTVHLGVDNLKGTYEYSWTAMRGVLSRRGQIAFNLESVVVEVRLQQSSKLQEKPIVDSINVTLGPTSLATSGIGAVNYILEMIFNVHPNVFRQRISDAAEYPLTQVLEDELQKINIESFIEENELE